MATASVRWTVGDYHTMIAKDIYEKYLAHAAINEHVPILELPNNPNLQLARPRL